MKLDKIKISSVINDLISDPTRDKENFEYLITVLATQPFFNSMNETERTSFLTYQDALIKYVQFTSITTTLDLFEKLPSSDTIYKDDH